jgi:hypothetical protein
MHLLGNRIIRNKRSKRNNPTMRRWARENEKTYIATAALTAGARAITRAAGELTRPEQRYALAGGGRLELAVGDAVMTQVNDYRSRTGSGIEVLNGYRTGRDAAPGRRAGHQRAAASPPR